MFSGNENPKLYLPALGETQTMFAHRQGSMYLYSGYSATMTR